MRRFAGRLANGLTRQFGYDLVRRDLVSTDLDAFEQQRRLLAGTPSPVIFDVGAHQGETSAIYSKLFPAARIHAFEPFPDSCRALSQNTEGLPVTVHQIGFAEVPKTAALNANASSATNSLLDTHYLAAKVWGGGLLETVGRVSCRFTTVDQFCADNGIDRIHLLKLDVQGAEYRVLRGAANLLWNASIDLIYMEIILQPTYKEQRRLSEYLDLLEGHGMVLHGLYNLSHSLGRLRQVDAIFVRA
jgi:FkbM family methyltransferase